MPVSAVAPSVVTVVSTLSASELPILAALSVAVVAVMFAVVEFSPLPSVMAPVAVSVTIPGAVTLFKLSAPPVVSVISLLLPAADAVNVIAVFVAFFRNTPPAVAVAVSVVTGTSINVPAAPIADAVRIAVFAVSAVVPLPVMAPEAVKSTLPVPALITPSNMPPLVLAKEMVVAAFAPSKPLVPANDNPDEPLPSINTRASLVTAVTDVSVLLLVA